MTQSENVRWKCASRPTGRYANKPMNDDLRKQTHANFLAFKERQKNEDLGFCLFIILITACALSIIL